MSRTSDDLGIPNLDRGLIRGYLFIMTNTTTTEKLTAETVTDKQIRDLRKEAMALSPTDHEMIDICNRALCADGDTQDQDGGDIAYADWTQAQARESCADAINNARAMEGT